MYVSADIHQLAVLKRPATILTIITGVVKHNLLSITLRYGISFGLLFTTLCPFGTGKLKLFYLDVNVLVYGQ
jgi:hypothetical protein